MRGVVLWVVLFAISSFPGWVGSCRDRGLRELETNCPPSLSSSLFLSLGVGSWEGCIYVVYEIDRHDISLPA